MNDPKQQVSQSRRRFLRDAGVSGGIAVAAAATPAVLAAEPLDETPQKPAEGYRLTSHILAYYKSAAS